MSSKIEQIIEEIEEYVDGCKPQTLSKTNIIVNKEEIEELLRELRMKTPEEIKRYQKVLAKPGCDPGGRAGQGGCDYQGGQYTYDRIDKRTRDHAAGLCAGQRDYGGC